MKQIKFFIMFLQVKLDIIFFIFSIYWMYVLLCIEK